MWIYCKTGFLSVVAHRGKPNILMVRARRSKDLRNFLKIVFKDSRTIANKILYTPENDYAYRYELTRSQYAKGVAFLAQTIDYGNFKDSLPKDDHQQSSTFMSVWNATLHGFNTGKYAASPKRSSFKSQGYSWRELIGDEYDGEPIDYGDEDSEERRQEDWEAYQQTFEYDETELIDLLSGSVPDIAEDLDDENPPRNRARKNRRRNRKGR